MSTALLDKIESAIDHARPKDARRLLDELRESLQAGPTPAGAAHSTTPTGRDGAADQPVIEIDMALGGGVSLRCAFPPTSATGYRLALSPAQGANGHALAPSLEQGRKAWRDLLDRYKGWSDTRQF